MAGAELAGLAFYEVDFGAGALYIDDRFRDLCGIPPDREQGLQPLEFWMEHVHPDDRPRVMEMRGQLHDGTVERLILEYRFLAPGQGQKWIHHMARVSARDAAGRAVKYVRRPPRHHGRKRAENELRDLSRRLIRRPRGGESPARPRAARRREPAARRAGDRGRPRRARRTRRGAGEAMQAVREGLVQPQRRRPLPGLPAAPLDPRGARTGRGAAGGVRTAGSPKRLDVAVDLDPCPRSSADVALCLFRVAQEALSNVARHAGATPRRSRCGQWTAACSCPSATTASASTRRSAVRGCTSAWRACASVCDWWAGRSTSRARPAGAP